ncbi:hypothetical protein LEL_07392 [Akanthomyces lecanii RCEF 1005]|uniref:Uncharacterized protein n=1 Tax=Akanthomyces lecanii RCEF 1005 TaxID=1081108 RepID=A0A168FN21_CORDF|nr:hypothetical protein LEL_07392 [Akanthomyces lecanii RCEF 1005]
MPLAATAATEPKNSDPQSTLHVDARTLKVFGTLFFDPDVTSTPGSVPWDGLLHAMAPTGCQAEKLYGSVWQFSPSNLDVERGIHFHEPRPQGQDPFRGSQAAWETVNDSPWLAWGHICVEGEVTHMLF